jgi:hypothetical protein
MHQNIITLDISEHALKRLNLILGEEKAHREVRFMHQFIRPGSHTIAWNYGIQLHDVLLYSERCLAFDTKILGFETHMAGPYPLYEFCYEDYNSAEDWVKSSIRDIESKGISDFLVPTIDIPEYILRRYLM